ncbi:hypothetical protein Hanom_Chr12g01161171 [Helianthus anomalus]
MFSEPDQTSNRSHGDSISYLIHRFILNHACNQNCYYMIHDLQDMRFSRRFSRYKTAAPTQSGREHSPVITASY